MTGRPTSPAGARACRVPAVGRLELHPAEPPPARPTDPPRRRAQRGAVTAEAAMVLPVLVLTVLGLAWLLTVAVAQIRVTDAAREVARLVARDEASTVAVARGREVAPPGTEFDVSVGDRDVVVEARLELDGPAAVLRLLPGVTVDSRAVAAREVS